MPKRARGSGTLYLRGNTWWIQYWDHGQPRYESSASDDRSVADNILKQRIGDIAAGREITPSKATVDDLFRLVLADYKLRKLRDVKTVEWRYKAHVKPLLGSMQAARVKSAQIRAYIEIRIRDNASSATINRELSIVRRGFTLGRDEDPPLVHRVPKIPKLEEDNARQGFLEPEHYERLLSTLPPRLKALFVCAYHVGTRKGELRKLLWSQVDLGAKVIRLEAKQTKGKKPRTLPIYGDMGHGCNFR